MPRPSLFFARDGATVCGGFARWGVCGGGGGGVKLKSIRQRRAHETTPLPALLKVNNGEFDGRPLGDVTGPRSIKGRRGPRTCARVAGRVLVSFQSIRRPVGSRGVHARIQDFNNKWWRRRCGGRIDENRSILYFFIPFYYFFSYLSYKSFPLPPPPLSRLTS